MKKYFKVIPYLAIAMYGISFSECTYDHLDPNACDNIPDSISFTADIVPIFSTHCSTLLCHSGSEPAANLNLEAEHAFASLSKEGSGYLKRDNPTHSVLYAQLNSLSLPMPPDGKLDPCTISTILKWIEQGAKDN